MSAFLSRISWVGAAGALCMIIGLFLPIGVYDDDLAFWSQFQNAEILEIVGLVGLIAGELWLKRLRNGRSWAVLGPIVLMAAAAGLVV